jgi:hypothetical protein
MCSPASFIIVKGQPPVWSKYTESHTEIRKEFGLPENTDTLTANVQVELSPENGDLKTPIKNWVFRVDQDRLPTWWDANEAEIATRKEIKKWAKQKLITKDCAELRDGQFYVVGGTISQVLGGTISQVSGGTISQVWGGTISQVSGGTISQVSGGTISQVWGGTISQVSGGTISQVWGGTISQVWGGQVIVYTATNPNILKSSKAVMIDRSGKGVVCHVGKDA